MAKQPKHPGEEMTGKDWEKLLEKTPKMTKAGIKRVEEYRIEWEKFGKRFR